MPLSDDISRIITNIKNKIFLLIGRAILTAINNDGTTQKIQIKGLKGETITDIDRVQDYGLESHPKVDGAEAVILFIGGNRANGVAVNVNNKTHRPSGLSEGDVYLYDYRGTQIKIDSAGITLNTGDASTWKPNVIATCPLTGLPHGGTLAGITKLKGE